MYLATPQRYPYMKGIPNSPVMPRNFYPASTPTMSFVQPLTAPNTGRPQQQFPISSRGPLPFPYHRASTPQARPTGKTVPSNPPQFIQGNFPLNFQPQVRPQNKIVNQQPKPQSKTIPATFNRPSSAQPVQQNPKQANEKQMIQNLSKENQDLKKKLAEKEQELQKLKAREEALEQKFKELQEQAKK